MTARLNQIIAVEKGAKNRINDAITAAYHACKKTELFQGLIRRYQPKNEDGVQYPDERKLPLANYKEILRTTKVLMVELFDIVRTKDEANMRARADIVVDGKVLLAQVPVSHILFLEKQLTDLRTILGTITPLDPTETWTWEDAKAAHVSETTTTFKTAKVNKVLVKYEATKEHPAQTELVTEDVIVGTWSQTKLSGAIPPAIKGPMLARVEKLLEAVKAAREAANSIEAPPFEEGETILGYILGE